MKTLTQLRIDHFRGIRDLNIEHLTSINVIVGDNNCGKTSVMEAIQFLRSGSPANIYNIARLRDRSPLMVFPASDTLLSRTMRLPSTVSGSDALASA